MTFPLINRIYTHPDYNRNLLLWGQDLFFNVYVRTCPKDSTENSQFIKLNWWSFMLKAKYTGFEIGEDNKLIES